MITVCIPSIPPRAELLRRAVASVDEQLEQPHRVIITIDHDKEGAPATRQRALDQVETEYVAFLDDDDEFLPEHLHVLLEHAKREKADLVYPWFTVIAGTDPFPHHFGKAFENDSPHQVPITFLAKTESVRLCDGFLPREDDGPSQVDDEGNRAGEDFRLICRMAKAEMKIVHVPQRTWLWHHDSGNTSGLPTRW